MAFLQIFNKINLVTYWQAPKEINSASMSCTIKKVNILIMEIARDRLLWNLLLVCWIKNICIKLAVKLCLWCCKIFGMNDNSNYRMFQWFAKRKKLSVLFCEIENWRMPIKYFYQIFIINFNENIINKSYWWFNFLQINTIKNSIR